MSHHFPHELAEEFPAQAQVILTLRASSARFARVADHYAEVNRAIVRMETNEEPADDFTIEALKKERLKLMDEIAVFLHP
ncbi:MAG: DUF465 domain-containing protein [Beijerinckiaceae bacterium]